MRVALFGGSFNPPHVAHQMVALYVLETAPVDQLWFIPCFQHAFGKPLAPFDDRFAMCGLTAAPLGPRAEVNDVERDIAQPSRTLVTVRALMARHPQHQFSWIVGGDLVPEIDTWYGAAELRRTIPFLIVGRAGAAAPPSSATASPATVMMPAVSSTDVRRALAERKSVQGLVPRTVLDYIYQRGLFQAREPE